jgi:hypothetical protein
MKSKYHLANFGCWTIHMGPEYLGHNKMADHKEDKLLGEGERVCKWMIGNTLWAREIENGKEGMEIITSNGKERI